MPQVQTASYCASRTDHVVGVSRFSVREYMRPSDSCPALRLDGDEVKNTPRYSSGLVSGLPTAPMTAGAHPWMPSAPLGAADARIRRRTREGRISAIS